MGIDLSEKDQLEKDIAQQYLALKTKHQRDHFVQNLPKDLKISKVIENISTISAKIEFLRFYNKKLENFNGIISLHGVYHDINVLSIDPLIKKIISKRIIDNIKIALKLNAKYVVFHTNYFPLIKHVFYQKHWIRGNAEFWTNIIKKYNIIILLENNFRFSECLLRFLVCSIR